MRIFLCIIFSYKTYAVDLKIKKPLFVTDKDLVNLLFIKNIISDIKKKFQELQIYSNFVVALTQ